MGSGCGSVGKAVASDTRDPRFESSHWQNLYVLPNCIEKRKITKWAHLKNLPVGFQTLLTHSFNIFT